MRRLSYLLTALALIGMVLVPQFAQAQATEPFLGQLMLFAGNFCPLGWLPADGRLLPINQATALFSILGTQYGGDSFTTFALPDLRSRVPIGVGQGNGLSPYNPGDTGGTETHALTINEMPSHTHQAAGVNSPGDKLTPGGNVWAGQDRVRAYSSGAPGDLMAGSAIKPTGGNQPFDIRQPYLAMQWCIAIQGVYPPRN